MSAIDIQDGYIVFELAGASYALSCDAVLYMDMVENVAPIPNAPGYVEGLVFWRGLMIPALNLRARFGFPKIPFDPRTRLIVVRLEERTVGLIVDSARRFVAIPQDAIQPPPESIAGLSGTYLKGIANHAGTLVLILSLKDILNSVDDTLLKPETSSEVRS